jgi:hypothetical protein
MAGEPITHREAAHRSRKLEEVDEAINMVKREEGMIDDER